MKNSYDNSQFESPDNAPSEAERLRRNYLSSPAHVHDLMQHCGWKPKTTPRLVNAACDLANSETREADANLDRISSFFRRNAVIVPNGLETIPVCWLRTIENALWSTRKPHWTKLPYFIARCAFEEGLLAIRFAQEEPTSFEQLPAWDRLRIILNYSVKPNLWTPLTQEQERKIWIKHAELRNELLSVRDSQ